MGRYQRIAELAELNQPGLHVVDLATGAGLQVRALLEAANPDVRISAVDGNSALDDALLLDARVRGVIADIEEPLPFADNSVDRVISLNVAEHLLDPQGHLQNLARILKPGGILVLAHSDWDTAMFASDDHELTRLLVDRFVRMVPTFAERADGFMGRRLLDLAQHSELELTNLDSWADPHRKFVPGSVGWKVAAGILHAAGDDAELAAQAQGWLDNLQTRANENRFLFTVTDVALVLRKRDV